jgi:hypothetical protein
VPSDPMHSNAGRVPPRSSTPTGSATASTPPAQRSDPSPTIRSNARNEGVRWATSAGSRERSRPSSPSTNARWIRTDQQAPS